MIVNAVADTTGMLPARANRVWKQHRRLSVRSFIFGEGLDCASSSRSARTAEMRDGDLIPDSARGLLARVLRRGASS